MLIRFARLFSLETISTRHIPLCVWVCDMSIGPVEARGGDRVLRICGAGVTCNSELPSVGLGADSML